MTDLTKLADALENIAHMEYPSGHHDGNNLREAAALLRSAAAVDVKALITIVQDFGSARWAEGFDEKNKPYGESALHKKVALKKLAELESALRLALAAREGWRPIETAPKDGRSMLLGYPNGAGKWRTVRGQWFSDAEIAETWEEDGDEGWYETSVECEDLPNCWSIEPTHWMPLPPAPKGTT